MKLEIEQTCTLSIQATCVYVHGILTISFMLVISISCKFIHFEIVVSLLAKSNYVCCKKCVCVFNTVTGSTCTQPLFSVKVTELPFIR